MMGSDAAFGKPFGPAAADRPRRRRRRAAAALPGLPRDRRRTRCAVRPLLGRDDILRPALVRGMRVCLAVITAAQKGHSSNAKSASGTQERFNRAALVHGTVTLSDLIEGQYEVENLPRIDLPLQDKLNQLGQEPADGGRTAVQMDVGEEKLLAIQFNPMRNADVAHRSAGAGRMD